MLHQHWRFAWLGHSLLQVSPGDLLLFWLEVFLNISWRFYRSESPSNLEEIARQLNASLAQVSYFMDLLQVNGLVLSPAGPDGQRPGEEAARTVGAVGQAWALKLRRLRDWLRLPQCGRRAARDGKRGIGTGGTDCRDSGSG